jgi:hypothetical protein
MRPQFGGIGFKERAVLFAQLVLQIGETSKQQIAVERSSPSKQCPSCLEDSNVFVKPDNICGRCWSHWVFCFEPAEMDVRLPPQDARD